MLGRYRLGGTANLAASNIVVPGNKGRALLWIDAQDPATILSQSGNEVTELADKAHGTPYRSDSRSPATGGPDTGTATIGGLNALDFDFTDVLRTHISSSDPPLVGNFLPLNDVNCVSIGVVCDASSAGPNTSTLLSALQGPVGGSANDRNMQFTLSHSSNRASFRGQWNNFVGIDTTSTSDFFDSPKILTATLTLPSRSADIGNNLVLHKFHVNGTSAETSGSINWSHIQNNSGFSNDRVFAPGSILIGARSSNHNHANTINLSNEQFGGLLGEMIVLAGYWDPFELDGYLAHKWNLASNLPAAHPYKAAPPILPAFV